jgi:hypothetical protein
MMMMLTAVQAGRLRPGALEEGGEAGGQARPQQSDVPRPCPSGTWVSEATAASNPFALTEETFRSAVAARPITPWPSQHKLPLRST